VVGRDIFLDGNSFSDGPSVEKNHLVGDVQAGFVVNYNPVRIGYTYVFRTEQFENQGGEHIFGAVSISVRF